MLEPDKPLTPQPPLPLPWGKILAWVAVIGFLVALAVLPTFRSNVLHALDVTKRFFAKLFGF
jgi:hypothetical protein